MYKKEMSLYKITNNFVELMDKAEEGELTQEEYNKLGEELALELQNKSSSIIGFTKNVELTINAMKEEEKRISNLRKSLENKNVKFKQYVKENMERLNIKKIETELGNLTIAKNPMSVEVTDEDSIPKEFKDEVITIKINKTRIKEHYKSTGEIIKGTFINETNTNLRIK